MNVDDLNWLQIEDQNVMQLIWSIAMSGQTEASMNLFKDIAWASLADQIWWESERNFYAKLLSIKHLLAQKRATTNI